MLLRDWSDHLRTYDLDLESGVVRLLTRGPSRVLGMVRVLINGADAIENNPLPASQNDAQGFLKRLRSGAELALYEQGQTKYLQAGSRRWRIGDPGVKMCILKRRGAQLLELQNDGDTHVFKDSMMLSSLLGRLDPTFDRLDADMEQFFTHVFNLHRNSGGRVSFRQE